MRLSQTDGDVWKMKGGINRGLYKLNLRLTVINMNELQCPKCASGWTQENPPKKLVNCHHNLCLRCLKDELVCPIDKSRIEKRKYTHEAFHTNMELLESVMLSKMGKPREKPKGHSRSQSSSNISSNKCAKEFTTPIMDKYTVIEEKRPMIREKQTVVEVQLPCLSPEKGNETSSKLTISPKKVRLSFDTCLLHSKKADLICLEDKCLICANCGLFGQHKQHKIIPYDEFLNQYSKITEESFKIYELLKQRQDKLDHALLEAKIDEILKEKRDAEVKHIKTNTTAYIDFIKRLQRQLILDLDVAFDYKRKKMQKYDHIQEMISKRQQFIESIQTMSNGVDDIFNLENIGQYINYIDKESPHSFIINEGEYLLLEIDNYYKQKMQAIENEASDITFDFTFHLDLLKDSVNLLSKDFKEISMLIEQSKKKVVQKKNPYSNKQQTPHRTPVTSSVNNSQSVKNMQKSPNVKIATQDDQLLIGTNSKSNSKGSQQKLKKEISPIQPASTFDDDHPLIKPYEGDNKDLDNFLKFSQVQCISCISPAMLPRHPSIAANQGNRSKKLLDHNRENDLTKSRASKSRSKYGTSERQSMANVLGEKSQNKKKRKLDLPDKYLKIYQDLQKDKLQVLDLGGVFLGEPNILTISQLFTSRCKLRSVKLMNNKLSDESFPEIISRCRFIQSVNLSYNLLTEKSLEWLEQCCDNLGELKNITLSNNKIVLRNVRERLQGLARRGIKVSL